ncbi:MAG: hypothetical protein ABI165_01310 [Bryobacteraceae bacterium]
MTRKAQTIRGRLRALSSRLTPRAIGGAAVVSLAVWTGVHTAAPGGWLDGVNIAEAAVKVVSTLAAFLVALLLCLEIAGEYRRNGWLRAAWMCLAICSAVSLVRNCFDTPLVDLVHPGYWTSQWSSVMREVPAAIALMFLAAGILTMAVAFWRLGLGFALRWYDAAAMGGVFVVLALILVFRNDLSAAHLRDSVPRQAQLFSQVMFAVAAAGSIVLFRIGKQMGGGHLARAMGWIIAHILLRAILVLATAVEAHLHLKSVHIDFVHTFLGIAASWMFALAASSRGQVTHTAVEQAAKWGVTAGSPPVDAIA